MGPVPQNGGAAPGGTDMLMQFLPLILMFVIFWFLLIRPQQKRTKAHKQMLAELKPGDRVQTGSGFVGRIVEIDDEQVLLECGDSKLRMVRGAIAGFLADGKNDKADRNSKSGKSSKADKTKKADNPPAHPAALDKGDDADKTTAEEKPQNL
jgi:preprotein translocase subunit YajC